MTFKPRTTSYSNELWNVSLLPTVKTTPTAVPPHGPNPSGGRALEAPALLSISEAVAEPLPIAA